MKVGCVQNLTAGWPLVRLADICEIRLGKMLSPVSKTGTRSRPYLRNLNVKWGRFDLADVAEMDFSEDEEAKFELRRGDLLVCEGGEPGRAAVWDGAITPCYYQKALHRLRPIRGSVDMRYVMYRLWAGSMSGEFLGSHAKTTIAHLPEIRLRELLLPLPSVHEQQTIVAKLDEQLAALDRAHAACVAQFAAAQDLPRAYLRSAFSEHLSSHARSCRLSDVLRLRKEVVYPHDNPSGPATFVGLEHIESVTGVRVGSIALEMSQLEGRKPRFHTGDIVYGYLRPYLNKVWIAEFDGLCSVDQYVFQVDAARVDTTYIAWFMRSPLYLERAPIDTTPGQLPRIRTEEVLGVEVELPSLREQQRIGAEITRRMQVVQTLIASLGEQLATINGLPAALLRQAFECQDD